MLREWQFAGKEAGKRFAEPPWTRQGDESLRLEERLPADHLARRIERAVEQLDLTSLVESYAGVGKRALRPDLMVKIVMYEMHSQRLSPAQWARDVKENEPLRWLARGLEPSRTRLYEFRDRIASYVDDWNGQVLERAVEEGMTSASRGALDGSSVAAAASRRQLANRERLAGRSDLVQAVLTGRLIEDRKPQWLASTPLGLVRQKRTYQRAGIVLQKRLEQNRRRRSSKRKPEDKVLVSLTDPEAALGRDKLDVFRPLFNVQLLRDLDSPLVLAYETFAVTHDAGLVSPMLERMTDLVGRKPEQLLADSGYVSLRDLETCAGAEVTLFAPWQENDYSQEQGKKIASNQFTQIPKTDFSWLEEEQTFICPQGHRLEFRTTKKESRLDYEVTLHMYSCPGEYCSACPRQGECTRNPKKGRTVSRLENETLLDQLRERMHTPEAKALYKLRSQTVELVYADLKEHRGLRRFRSRGLRRAKTQVALAVLAHNILALEHELENRHAEGWTNASALQAAA
jgi:transposase